MASFLAFMESGFCSLGEGYFSTGAGGAVSSYGSRNHRRHDFVVVTFGDLGSGRERRRRRLVAVAAFQTNGKRRHDTHGEDENDEKAENYAHAENRELGTRQHQV
jgi:hypothetical protein